MELIELITKSNEIDAFIKSNSLDELIVKELRKIEMYCRKTYLMLVHMKAFINEEDIDPTAFLTNLNVALVKDQKYIKARDSLGDYSIG